MERQLRRREYKTIKEEIIRGEGKGCPRDAFINKLFLFFLKKGGNYSSREVCWKGRQLSPTFFTYLSFLVFFVSQVFASELQPSSLLCASPSLSLGQQLSAWWPSSLSWVQSPLHSLREHSQLP